MLPPRNEKGHDDLGMVGMSIVCQAPCNDYHPEPFEDPDETLFAMLDVHVSDVEGAVWEEAVSTKRPVAGAIATAMPYGGYYKDDLGMTCVTWYLGYHDCCNE